MMVPKLPTVSVGFMYRFEVAKFIAPEPPPPPINIIMKLYPYQQILEPNVFLTYSFGLLHQVISQVDTGVPPKHQFEIGNLQGGSNMTGTDLCVNKPHCAEAVRP